MSYLSIYFNCSTLVYITFILYNRDVIEFKMAHCRKLFKTTAIYGTHHSYVLVVHTLRVAENEILKLDFPAKRH
jgi:hypothetical protein